jgi:hypothetical protein
MDEVRQLASLAAQAATVETASRFRPWQRVRNALPSLCRQCQLTQKNSSWVLHTSLGLMNRLSLSDVLEGIVSGRLPHTPHGYMFQLEPGTPR